MKGKRKAGKRNKLKVIIDNSALGNLLGLNERLSGSGPDVLKLLKKIFAMVYVPIKVRSELSAYEKVSHHISQFLFRLSPEKGFFRICVHEDSIERAFLEDVKGIDDGELAAIVQAPAVDTNIILIDDKKCIDAVKDKKVQVRCIQSLYVLSYLDIKGHVTNWNILISSFQQISPFKKKELRENYAEAYMNIYSERIKKSILEKKMKYDLP